MPEVRTSDGAGRGRGLGLALALGLGLGGCAGEAAQGRPWVHSVALEGVKQVSGGELADRLAVTSTSRLPFARKAWLNALAVDEDRERIEAWYRARGYHEARVTDAEVTLREGGDSVDVRFSIVEGPPVRIAAVHLVGAEHFDKQLAQRVHDLDLLPGQIFDHELYLAQKDGLVGRLKSHGYPWAEVRGEVAIDRDRREADVTLTLEPGPLACFGELVVRGARIIDPELVRQQVELALGDRFRLEEVEAARARAYGIGVFSSVKVHYERMPGAGREGASLVRVVLTVEETTFNQLRIGGGVGLDAERNEVRTQLFYTRRNFLGGLRVLELHLAPAWVVMPAVWNIQRSGPALNVSAMLTQPHPGPLTSLSLTVGYDLGIEYAYQYQGPRTVLAALRRLWKGRVTLGASYNFQLLTFFNTDPAILSDPAQAGRLFGYVDPYRLGFFAETIAIDLRNSPIDTRKGGSLALRAEEGGVFAGGAFTFEKLEADARGYLPLGRHVVLAARTEIGHIFVQGDLGSPITDRFYLGGPDSHRGFNFNRLSRQVPSGITGVSAIPIGGDEMFLGQLEVRVNVARVLGGWLSTALFLDAGDVAEPSCKPTCTSLTGPSAERIDFARLHWATGGGVRYRTIIGTIRADLGVRLNRLAATEPDGLPNPDPGDRFAFHLSVGEAF